MALKSIIYTSQGQLSEALALQPAVPKRTKSWRRRCQGQRRSWSVGWSITLCLGNSGTIRCYAGSPNFKTYLRDGQWWSVSHVYIYIYITHTHTYIYICTWTNDQFIILFPSFSPLAHENGPWGPIPPSSSYLQEAESSAGEAPRQKRPGNGWCFVSEMSWKFRCRFINKKNFSAWWHIYHICTTIWGFHIIVCTSDMSHSNNISEARGFGPGISDDSTLGHRRWEVTGGHEDPHERAGNRKGIHHIAPPKNHSSSKPGWPARQWNGYRSSVTKKGLDMIPEKVQVSTRSMVRSGCNQRRNQTGIDFKG